MNYLSIDLAALSLVSRSNSRPGLESAGSEPGPPLLIAAINMSHMRVAASMAQPEFTTSRAAVLTSTKVFEFQERKVEQPGPGMCLIRQQFSGLCGSDVHYWAHGKCGVFEVDGPIILGHESAGVVVGVGEGVTNVATGDRVALEPGVPCRTCEHCRSGLYNLCADVEFLATPPYDGSLSQFMLHAADFCFKLPDHVPSEHGALLEPLSVGVHACERAGVSVGSSVLIMGAGPIGLVCLLTARAAGATTIILSDVNKDRLNKASEMGASAVVDASASDFIQQVFSHTGGSGASVTMDCSGAEAAIRAGLKATRPGGKFVSIGRGAKNDLSIPFFEVMDKEIDILGVFRYRNAYPKALALLASGLVDVAPLISHRFDLDHVQDAFELAQSGKGIKVMVEM